MGPPLELSSFGIDREHEYTGHITLATRLVPLPRRTFASTDETHIRIWGPSGDVVKTTFPSNRRSMVSAMTYCPTFNVILTSEVDMTMKAYFIHTLDLLDTFPLGQAIKQKGEKAAGAANEKVSAIVYLPHHCWVLVAGENGCDLWQLGKSNRRRAGGSLGRLEHHLQLVLLRRVTSGPVLNIVADMAEHRIIMWGPRSLSIFDEELNLITSYNKPHAEPMHCACIQILSILDTALLTGGEDGNVNFWSIQGKQNEGGLDEFLNEKSPTTASASMRLEHSFRGHSRTVEMVCFYHKKQSGETQSLCTSYARDGKMKVWSLIQFSIVYTLDLSFLDSKVFVFPLAQHCFAISASASGGSQTGQGQQRTMLTLMRFTAHIACPFATTNQSAVVLINRPLPPPDFQPLAEGTQIPALTGSVALVSEDVAVRIVDAELKRLVACLPPPPNSKVQVLKVFLVPIWQILVLWLSSQEIAIFYVPTASADKSKKEKKDSDTDGGDGADAEAAKRAVKSTTPLLIRRFSILEVRAHTFDKDLPKEAFRTVCLHHGKSPPSVDALTQSSFETGYADMMDNSSVGESGPDWFLMIGTHQGTLQAFRLRDILAASPIWMTRIVRHLPTGSWKPPRSFQPAPSMDTAQSAASDIEQARLEAFEAELMDAIESAKVAGQRPFPRDAPKLRFYGRWKCHDYFIEVTESCGHTLMTTDMKRNLRLWDVETMQCVFLHHLEQFACYTPYFQPVGMVPKVEFEQETDEAKGEAKNDEEASFSGLAALPDDKLGFSGIALGSKSGNLQLILLDNLDANGEPEVIQSSASHTKEVLQIDFVWPVNVFATIGADDILKIWSHGLVLLREIGFPQPLTAVQFQQRHDLDTAQGHGDILVGFSCHVETLSFEYWSQGTPVELIGRDATRGRSKQSRSEFYTNRGLAMLDASDDIDEHSLWLHSDDPEKTRQNMHESKQGVSLCGAANVLHFKNVMMKTILEPTHPRIEELQAQRSRLEQGEVTDFRGAPLMEIASLSGQAVDHAVLALPNRPSKEPTIRHQRTTHHNRGDFVDYTHAQTGYYDQYIHPSIIVDAPRIHAIRGGVDGNGAAIITSVGSMQVQRVLSETQLPSPPTSPLAAASSASKEPQTGEPSRRASMEEATPEKDFLAKDTAASSSSRAPVKPRPRNRTATQDGLSSELSQQAQQTQDAPSQYASEAPSQVKPLGPHDGKSPLPQAPATAGGSSSHDGQKSGTEAQEGEEDEEESVQQDKQPGAGDESWRCRRIARGVPRDNVSKPRTQDIANTDLDTARLLAERGNMAEVPDLPEENALKRLMIKKSEWLYSPRDSLVLNAKRNTIQHMTTEEGKTQMWTKAGRLVCDIGNRPPVQNVSIPMQLPPHIAKLRMPVTRMEVTEQRIIAKAAAPSPLPPQFTLEAKAPSSARRYRPLSSRLPGGPPGERNSASAAGSQGSGRSGRVLVETLQAHPLTAR